MNKNPKQIKNKSSCLIFGNKNVGKNSFIYGLKSGYQETHSFSALGVEMAVYEKYINSKKISILLWYIVSEFKFQGVANKIFEKLNICIFLYDVTNRKSLEWLHEKWEEIKNNLSGRNITYMLIGNKCDLEDKREVSYDEGKDFADTRNFLYIETSAKTGKNIENAFSFLISTCL